MFSDGYEKKTTRPFSDMSLQELTAERWHQGRQAELGRKVGFMYV